MICEYIGCWGKQAKKHTAFERSQSVRCPRGYDKKRSGVVEDSEVQNHAVQSQQNGSVNTRTSTEDAKVVPWKILRPKAAKDTHR